MFESRLRIKLNVAISPELRAFVCEKFQRGGSDEFTIQDVQESVADSGRADLCGILEAIRAEYGNLWLKREWWLPG